MDEIEQDRRPGWQARAARKRKGEERTAATLEGRGWVCLPPEMAEAGRALLAGKETEGAR